MQAILFSSWTAHVPHIKAQLGLSDASLGLALLGPPLGSVTAMILSGYLLPRVGSRRMVQVCLVGYCLAGPAVGIANSLISLFVVLTVWGAFQGALDVSMNTQAITVERSLERPVMSGLHGFWSIGAFTGAAIGAGGVAIGLSLRDQVAALGVLILAGVLPLVGRLLPDPPPDHAVAERRRRRRIHPTIAILAAICFASLLCEGAVADWAAVYLHGSLAATPAVAALAYAAFALAMVIVRLSGDRLLIRHRASVVLPILAAIAAVGLAIGLLLDSVVAAIVGFAALGLGVAAVVPCVFSAAGRVQGMNPGTAVATVAAIGWVGLVSGPPLIGQLATWTSLPQALWLLPVLVAVVAVATARSRILDAPGGAHALAPGSH